MAPFVKKLVTGYVPIGGHPRSAKEYGELGEELFANLNCVAGDFSIHPFYERVEDTWLHKTLHKYANFEKVSHSVADNPKKNSLAYHCVQHQKFGWLVKSLLTGTVADTYVWMDYGIAHVPGVTPAVVDEFMQSIKPGDFAIPGCWPSAGLIVNDYFPCWRYCGGLMVVPKTRVHKLYKQMKRVVTEHIVKTNNVTWEVNSLAEAEKRGFLSDLRWYQADHNQTMFTNYGADHEPDPDATVRTGEEASD